MEKKKRYSPPGWLPFMFWRTAFVLHNFKEAAKSKETFFRYLRECEKLLWVKLTYPPGRYSVKENAYGEIEVFQITVTTHLTALTPEQEQRRDSILLAEKLAEEEKIAKHGKPSFELKNRFFHFTIHKETSNKDKK